MRPNGPSTAESNIKRFLDGCAYILLRDDPGDTLTDYKNIMIGSKELSVSSCPARIADVIDGGGATLSMGDEDERLRFDALLEALDARAAKYQKRPAAPKKPRQSTRFERLAAIRKEYPGCAVSCPLPVDTAGEFEYAGARYKIDPGCERYAPRATREGAQYDMDRITVVALSSGEMRFYDHDIYPLDATMIRKI